MKLWKKLLAVWLVLAVQMNCAGCGTRDQTAKSLYIEQETTVYVWYYDQQYEPYLKAVAERFRKVNERIKIEPVLKEADNFLQNIYEESIRGENTADVYLMSSDDLEKACMLGLAAENSTYSRYYTKENYCSTALEAASYKNRLYGYPVSFNTAFMVYNKKYGSSLDNFQELTDYIEQYRVTEDNQDVQQIISWDVSDLMLNYNFSCKAFAVGGESGEDSTSVQFDSDRLKEAMEAYASMRDAYGIDRASTSQANNADMFTEGRLIYTIIDMEHFKKVYDSQVDFGICEIPDLQDRLTGNSLSETVLAIANPYASNIKLAKAVAHSLSYDYSGLLLSSSGFLGARRLKYSKKERENLECLYGIYESSAVKGQFMGADNFYALYEIMMHQVWDGADASACVDAFSSLIAPQGEKS